MKDIATLLPPAAAGLAALAPPERDQRIIAICDGAIARLTEARDMEEVTGLRDIAAAFALYAQKLKAAMDAQNQCQQVVLLAEIRIDIELKSAQERGDIQRPDGDRTSIVRTTDNAPPTLPDLGIPRQRAAEYKQLAEAGPDRVREEVTKATAEGRRVTRRDVLGTAPRKPARAAPSPATDEAMAEEIAALQARVAELEALLAVQVELPPPEPEPARTPPAWPMPDHVRMARYIKASCALLGWDIADLAAATGLDLAAVQALVAEGPAAFADGPALKSIREALRKAGTGPIAPQGITGWGVVIQSATAPAAKARKPPPRWHSRTMAFFTPLTTRC